MHEDPAADVAAASRAAVELVPPPVPVPARRMGPAQTPQDQGEAMTAISAGRHDSIRRAITLIDTAAPADLAGYLAQTSLHDHIKADPATLRQHLTAATTPGADIGLRFGAWKAAQQILRAAGLPY